RGSSLLRLHLRRAELSRDHRQYETTEAMNAQRALLAGIVDYAGVFPPAALDVPAAVRNFAAYRSDDAAWMLGRFVAPAARLRDVETEWSALGLRTEPMHVAATAGADPVADIDLVHRFNGEAGETTIVDAVEAKLASANAIRAAASRAGTSIE